MATFSDSDFNLSTQNKDLKIREDVDAVNNSIRNIITIQKYQMPGNPDLGCDLETILFEIMDEITFSLIREIIDEEIIKWEPRILIRNIDIEAYSDTNQLVIILTYDILELNIVEESIVVKLDL